MLFWSYLSNNARQKIRQHLYVTVTLLTLWIGAVMFSKNCGTTRIRSCRFLGVGFTDSTPVIHITKTHHSHKNKLYIIAQYHRPNV